MTDGTVRKHFVFSGLVQGVGFRWRARRAAGWVRNDLGGTVTMELQGTEEQIESVLAAIERGSYIRIESVDARRIPTEENERGFFFADEHW